MKNSEEKSILQKLYEVKQYEMEEEIRKIENDELDRKINPINMEEIIKLIKEQNRTEQQKEILEKVEKIIENYEIKISFYSEMYYKEGVKDGINLYKECIKK